LPALEQLGEVVVLYEVGRRSAWCLNLLVAVANGPQDDGTIADELVVSMSPDDGADDTVGFGRWRTVRIQTAKAEEQNTPFEAKRYLAISYQPSSELQTRFS
jgi:hypothetical protein